MIDGVGVLSIGVFSATEKQSEAFATIGRRHVANLLKLHSNNAVRSVKLKKGVEISLERRFGIVGQRSVISRRTAVTIFPALPADVFQGDGSKQGSYAASFQKSSSVYRHIALLFWFPLDIWSNTGRRRGPHSLIRSAVYDRLAHDFNRFINKVAMGAELHRNAKLQGALLPGGERLALRPATSEDEQFLLSVYDSTRAEELAQVEWQPSQREAFIKWQFDLQRGEYNARFPEAEYDLILVDACPAGRIWIGRSPNEIRLLDIALLPKFQNRGAGTMLLRQLIDEAKRTNKPLRHMVFMLNNAADRFYERLGFVVIEDLGAYRHMEWKG